MVLIKNKNTPRLIDAIVPNGKRIPRNFRPQLTYVEDGNTIREAALPIVEAPKESVMEQENPPVSDVKKRMFLRLAGLGGVGAIAAMMLPKRAQAYVMGGSPTSAVVGIKDAGNNRMTPAKETGGNLDQINLNTAPLLVSTEGAYIQQDSSGTIAKETGGNLATIATNTGNLSTISTNIPVKGQAAMAASMPVVIASNQTPIPVTGSFSGGGGIDPVGLKDTTATQINPATDDAIVYLRRMVKIMESQATVDAANRQRIAIDSPINTNGVLVAQGTAANLLATVSQGTASSLNATVTIATGTNSIGFLATGTNSIGNIATVANMTTLAGQTQQMFQDPARNAFASGIRANLVWT